MMHIRGNTYYIKGPVCIGIYVRENKCVIMDTGLDESSAKVILRTLKEKEIVPSVIINTHSHADHIGGNSYIQKREQVITCASEKESVNIRHPVHEPCFLFAAPPLKELRNKFFMAAPSRVDRILETGINQIGSFEVDIVSLPGHSMEHIGIVTDDVLFCGDSVISSEIIGKYSLPYVFDVEQQLKTLKHIRGMDYSGYVMAHGGYVKDIKPSVDANIQVMSNIRDYFLEILKEPLTREDIIARFVEYKDIDLTMLKYPLLFSSVASYLVYMANNKMIRYYFENGKLYWVAN